MGLKRDFFKRLTVHSLGFRLAFVMALLVSVPLVVMGRRVVDISDQSIVNTVEQDYVQIAKYAADKVGIFVDRPKEVLNSLAAMLEAVPSGQWEQESLLVEIALRYDFFRRISLVNKAGQELVCSDLGECGSWVIDQDDLHNAMENGVNVSTVKFADNKVPYIEIIMYLATELDGAHYLATKVNVRGMWDVIDALRLGETGSAFMVDDSGLVLAHNDKKLVLQHTDFSKYVYIRAVLSGSAGYYELDEEGVKSRVIAYAPLIDLGWGLVIEQDADEVYKQTHLMRKHSLNTFLWSFFAAICLSFILGHFFALPIKRLLKHFNMLSKGVFQPIKNIRSKDELGNLLRAFNATGADVEERRKREQKDMVGDAAAWISHELKNSLNTLKTFIQLFPRKKEDEDFVQRFTKLMPDELQRVERLLRSFSESGEDNDVLRISEVELVSLLEDTALLLENTFNEKDVRFISEYEKSSMFFYADLDRLRQVFINLFTNALKAMDRPGAIKVCVKEFLIGEVKDAPWVEIRVSDTGKGIDDDRVQTIFKPFVTTGKKDNDGSMGLGLPICRRIVEQHGGSIRVESVLGEGTTFIIFLPLFVFKSEKKVQNA